MINRNRTIQTGLLCWALLAPLALIGQTNPLPHQPLPRQPVGNRYLLIVETSRAMHHRKDGVLSTVEHLLRSDLGGQLRQGDSIGVWTFNSELHAGEFPLQEWAPNVKAVVTDRVMTYLNGQKFGGTPRFEKVLPTVCQVVANSPFITVIIISSGTQPIKGTPFDDKFNSFFKTWQPQQETAKMPFVAALRAERGKFADSSVNVTPWAIELPALPPEVLLARTPPRPPQVQPKPAPAPVFLPPITFSGRKPAAAPPQGAQEPSAATPVTAAAPAVVEVKVAPAQATAPALPAVATASNETASQANADANARPEVQSAVPHTDVTPGTTAQTGVQPGSPAKSEAVVESKKEMTAPETSVERAANPEPLPAVSAVAVRSAAPVPETGESGMFKWALAFVAGLCLMGGVWVWSTRSRSRTQEHVSLITRSFERR
ncbi:MAG TPA: hypothetical protein VG167_16070 [Verrucomicrobiae bacterium]|nr:hypothetical protein [Verrucomicrobiae bacterium]